MVEQAVGDGESAALPLREQLAAPDMMNVTAEEDGFTILAHASVILPETDAIPYYRKGRFFFAGIDKQTMGLAHRGQGHVQAAHRGRQNKSGA